LLKVPVDQICPVYFENKFLQGLNGTDRLQPTFLVIMLLYCLKDEEAAILSRDSRHTPPSILIRGALSPIRPSRPLLQRRTFKLLPAKFRRRSMHNDRREPAIVPDSRILDLSWEAHLVSREVFAYPFGAESSPVIPHFEILVAETPVHQSISLIFRLHQAGMSNS
jgi:hypothetical protein